MIIVKKEEVDEKKGTKMMFGKRYNNCVKKEEFSDWRDELGYEGKDKLKKVTRR